MVILDGGLRELTTGQVGVWNAQQLSPDSVAYNINTHFEIHGALDVDLFVEALRRAVAEAEAYRLRVRVVDGVPWQFVGDADSCPIHVIDVSAEADPQASAEEWMRRDAARVLNLTRDPLAVQAVFLLGPERFFWYQRVHHLIVDGYSTAVFGAVVARHYTALRERRSPPATRSGRCRCCSTPMRRTEIRIVSSATGSSGAPRCRTCRLTPDPGSVPGGRRRPPNA
ncbi:condensation domain-containing protein [Luedemannella flava]